MGLIHINEGWGYGRFIERQGSLQGWPLTRLSDSKGGRGLTTV